MSKTLLLDCHVHFHECFHLSAFLHAAAANFEDAKKALALPPDSPGLLFFTETQGQNYFARFRSLAEKPATGGWRFGPTAEPTSLIAEGPNGQRLYLVAGRQIATSDGLELLALNSGREFPDGRSLAETLDLVQRHEALPIIPWGFGKWWFRRGRLLLDLLNSPNRPFFFLGDNGGRLGLAGMPRLFREARAKGVLTLPGTDPFPFPSECSKVARYGCVVTGPVDEQRSGASAVKLLSSQREQPPTYGRLEGLYDFCRLQTLLRAKKISGRIFS